MKIAYWPSDINNFHKSEVQILQITGQELTMETPDDCYEISQGQAKRLLKHFCGMKECHCPHGGILEIEPGRWGIRKKYLV